MSIESERPPETIDTEQDELKRRIEAAAHFVYHSEGGLLTEKDRAVIEKRFWREVIEREAQAASE